MQDAILSVEVAETAMPGTSCVPCQGVLGRHAYFPLDADRALLKTTPKRRTLRVLLIPEDFYAKTIWMFSSLCSKSSVCVHRQAKGADSGMYTQMLGGVVEALKSKPFNVR